MKAMTWFALALLQGAGVAWSATGNVDIYGSFNVSGSLPAFPLWSNSLTDRNGIAGSQLMFAPLLLATRETCAYGPADASGNGRITVSLKLKMADPDAGALGTVEHGFESEVLALGMPQGDAPPCRIQSSMPLWYGMGLAQANGNHYVVIGSAYMAETTTPGTQEVVWRDNSVYVIGVYKLDGTVKWRKRLTGLRGPITIPMAEMDKPFPYQGMFNLLGKSAVGDFLGNDGNAELRVASVRTGPQGALVYTYSYYDLETGGLLRKVPISVR